jgi:hypothetical protein
VLAISLAISVPAFAATNSNSYTYNQYSEAVERLSPYIAKNTDGTLYLKDEAKAIDIGSVDYNAILNNIKTVNSMISQGYLISDAHGNLTVTKKYVFKVQTNVGKNGSAKASKNTLTVYTDAVTTNSIQTKSSSAGVTKIVWNWSGFDLYLNNTNTQQLVKAQTITSGIWAAFPIPAAGIVAAVLQAFEAQLITDTNQGKGVVLCCIWSITNPTVIIPYGLYAQK